MVPRDDGIAPVQAVSVDLRLQAVSGAADGVKPKEAEKPAADAGSALRAPVASDAPRFELPNHDARVTFEKDDASGQMVMLLKDSSGKVIRQVPPDEMLRLARAIDQYLGLLVDRHS